MHSVTILSVHKIFPQDGNLKLPTIVQWQYACLSGSSYRYHWGDTYKPGIANTIEHWKALKQKPRATIVGKFAANAFGVYDMIGNVSEWLRESSGRKRMPKYTLEGNYQRSFVNSTQVITFTPNIQHRYRGFRLVEEMPEN